MDCAALPLWDLLLVVGMFLAELKTPPFQVSALLVSAGADNLGYLLDNLSKLHPCTGITGKAFPHFPTAAVGEELWKGNSQLLL